MKHFILFLSFGLLVGSMTIFGCRDNNVAAEQESIQSAEDNAFAEGEFASIFETVNDDANNSPVFSKTTGASKLLPNCVTCTVDTIQHTLTIDYGTTNCLCKDGLYRRGKIMATFTGKYSEIGSRVVITLEDYYVQDKYMTGTKKVERSWQAASSMSVEGATITDENGTISWSSHRTVEQIAGEGTLTPWDDVYRYSGSASGTNRNGVKFTVNTDTPLKRKIQIGCLRNFIAGKLTITNATGSTLSIDYDPIGGEPCDRTARVIVNGKSQLITLR